MVLVRDSDQCPPHIVEALLDDVEEVARHAATHRNCPPAALRAHATKGGKYDLYDVARNPSTPPDLLWEIARDGPVHERRVALENPSLPLTGAMRALTATPPVTAFHI